MQDPGQTWMIVGIVVALLVVAAVVWLTKKRRTERLRTHFGPEYDRALDKFGDREKAEHDLARRERSLRQLKIRPLTPEERASFSNQWRAIQSRFVDDP